MMRPLLPALLLLTTLPAAAAPAGLKPYTASYDVITHGIRAGVGQFKLRRLNDNRWRFSSKSHTTGIVSLFRDDKITQSSTFSIDKDGQLRAHRYHYAHSGHDSEAQSIYFDWQDDVARASSGGKKTTISIPEGAADPFLAQLKLSLRVATGRTKDRFPVINKNELARYQVRKVDQQGIKVPAGTFKTIRIERHKPGSSRTTVLWLSPRLHYIPVKIAQIKGDETVFRLELRSAAFSHDRQSTE